MDEIFKPFQPRGPLLPQSSILELLQECFGEWTKQIKPWKHKFNQVMFNIDLWGVRGWRQLLIHGFEYLVHLLSKAVTFAHFWLVSIKSNIFVRSTLCFNFLCSTTLSHRHVASEDSRRQESKPDEEQFQLRFLLLPCAVSVPSAFPLPFPVPFPVPFHGLCAPDSDFAM